MPVTTTPPSCCWGPLPRTPEGRTTSNHQSPMTDYIIDGIPVSLGTDDPDLEALMGSVRRQHRAIAAAGTDYLEDPALRLVRDIDMSAVDSDDRSEVIPPEAGELIAALDGDA